MCCYLQQCRTVSKVFWINVLWRILHSTRKRLGKIGNCAVKLHLIQIQSDLCPGPGIRPTLWNIHHTTKLYFPKCPGGHRRVLQPSTEWICTSLIHKRTDEALETSFKRTEKCRLQIQAHTHTHSSSRSADTAEWARNTDREGSCRWLCDCVCVCLPTVV